MPNSPTPSDPIEIHYYYACSWAINQHGINQFQDLAAIAAEMNVGLRVRQMFTDQYGYVLYPFTIKVPDEATLHEFVRRVAAGIGLDDWYIVNLAYYEQGVPFAANLEKVLATMPKWAEQMRAYAEHNAQVYKQAQTPPNTPE